MYYADIINHNFFQIQYLCALGLEGRQTNYLPVYAAWAAILVVVFPPVFVYI